MPKVLITGATGLIGYHLCRDLSERGAKLRVLHRPTSHLAILRGLRFEPVCGDLGDPESLEKAVRGCDQVFHLAAHVSMARADAAAMHRINVDGTRALAAAASKAGIRRFVHVSSIAAMGLPSGGPATEKQPYNHPPGRPYMETKHLGEQAAHAAGGAMQVMTVRPSLVVGPGPFRRGMIATLIRHARHRGIRLAPAGGCNIVDVDDVVQVLRSAMDAGTDGDRFLATGHNISTKDLLSKICALAGTRGPAITIPPWMTTGAAAALRAWELSGLPGQPPVVPMQLAGTQLFYDDSWTRKRLGLGAPCDLATTLERRMRWERQYG